jgi:hypothetical protein
MLASGSSIFNIRTAVLILFYIPITGNIFRSRVVVTTLRKHPSLIILITTFVIFVLRPCITSTVYVYDFSITYLDSALCIMNVNHDILYLEVEVEERQNVMVDALHHTITIV